MIDKAQLQQWAERIRDLASWVGVSKHGTARDLRAIADEIESFKQPTRKRGDVDAQDVLGVRGRAKSAVHRPHAQPGGGLPGVCRGEESTAPDVDDPGSGDAATREDAGAEDRALSASPEPQDPFKALADAAGGNWDGVDAVEYVKDLRGEPQDPLMREAERLKGEMFPGYADEMTLTNPLPHDPEPTTSSKGETMKILDELDSLREKVTTGPWYESGSQQGQIDCPVGTIGSVGWIPNGTYIVAACNAEEALVRVARAAEEAANTREEPCTCASRVEEPCSYCGPLMVQANALDALRKRGETMTEYRKGDRMLVDGNFMEDEPGSITVAIANNTAHPRFLEPSFVHPHPGVPLADVMEELEKARSAIYGFVHALPRDTWTHGLVDAVEAWERLRDARLAANKPKEV